LTEVFETVECLSTFSIIDALQIQIFYQPHDLNFDKSSSWS